jgi:uncharacterized damage-inducible protein DinB
LNRRIAPNVAPAAEGRCRTEGLEKMKQRSRATRLKIELDAIREQLNEQIDAIPPDELGWKPKPDMKSFQDLLLEIGAQERISLRWVRERETLEWSEAWDAIRREGEETGSFREALARVRAETLGFLAEAEEERLQTPAPLPQEWRAAFGAEAIEPEELIREIARHEYYHLGQIIAYRRIRGRHS